MPTSTDPLAALVEISWPEATVTDVMADAALFLGLGIAGAMLVGLAAKLLTHRPPTPLQEAERALQAARSAPADERTLALVKILGQITARKKDAPASLSEPAAQHWFDETFHTDLFASGLGKRLFDALYRPVSDVDLDAVEAHIRATLKRSR